MRILFITPSFPNRLHRIRAFQLLSELSKRHEVHVVSQVWEPVPAHELEELQALCASVTMVRENKWAGRLRALAALLRTRSLEVAYCRSSRMKRAVASLIREKDINLIYVKRLRSAQFVSAITTPVVIDSTDAMSMFYQRAAQHVPFPLSLIYAIETKRYAEEESLLAARYTKWVFCSSLDAEYMRSRYPQIETMVIPNGVDTEYFTPLPRAPDMHTLILSGLLTKFVNYEAAEYLVYDILPLITRSMHDVRLLLVGPAGRRATSLAGESVTVTGKVPDLREYLAKASLVCCSVLTGAGTRNKILQAWACGRPVVSTSAGAEGLEYEDGGDILIADSAEAFAAAVLKILNDYKLWESLVEGGRQRIEKCYAMGTIGDTLDRYLNAALTNGTPAPPPNPRS